VHDEISTAVQNAQAANGSPNSPMLSDTVIHFVQVPEEVADRGHQGFAEEHCLVDGKDAAIVDGATRSSTLLSKAT
jgi:hypothetical protein